MTNYNGRLDEVLKRYVTLSKSESDAAKQAISLLIKELVEGNQPKPNTSGFSDEYWRVNGYKVILMFETNLLKALEEV